MAGAAAAAAAVWGGHAVLGGIALLVTHRAAHRCPLPVAIALPLAMGAVWILLGAVPTALPGFGFPWLGPEAALVDVPWLLGAADLVGGVGVAGLLAFGGGAIGALLVPGRAGRHRWWGASAALLLLGFACGYGAYVHSRNAGATPDGTLGVLIIGLPADPDLLGDGDRRRDAFRRGLTESMAFRPDGGLDLVLWPESPTGSIGPPAPEVELASDAAEAFRAPVLFGAMGNAPGTTGGARSNRFLLASPGGGVEVVHEKRRLIPGVEWRLPGAPGRVVPGTARDAFGVPAPEGVGMGVLICFESLFPSEARRLRGSGAQVLFLGVNEGWLAGSAGGLADAARSQHRAAAVLLAVESRVPVLRSAVGASPAAWDQRGVALPIRARWEGEHASGLLVEVAPVPVSPMPFAVRGGAASTVAGAAALLLLLVLTGGTSSPTRGFHRPESRPPSRTRGSADSTTCVNFAQRRGGIGWLLRWTNSSTT